MTVIDMNKASFEKYTNADTPALVAFGAPWCIHCCRINRPLKKIAKEFGNDLIVGHVDIDFERPLAWREQVKSIPTVFLYQNGKRLGKIVAPKTYEQLTEFINSSLNNTDNNKDEK